MPMLTELELLPWESKYWAASDVGLGHLPLLNRVLVFLDCEGATGRQVEEEEAAWRRMVNAHPNRPSILVHRLREGWMKRDEDDDDEEISAKDHVDGNGADGNSAYTGQEPDNDPAKEEEEETTN
uniref:Disease resistance R13L4/SHOC-2-like LRR domain-containing protein n=1 Tax=Oryza glaberrima TaxID=4538 RepID=I1R1A2_ORYGL